MAVEVLCADKAVHHVFIFIQEPDDNRVMRCIERSQQERRSAFSGIDQRIRFQRWAFKYPSRFGRHDINMTILFDDFLQRQLFAFGTFG